MSAVILVVDDEPVNRALARAVLEGSYQVVEAASVEEGLAAMAGRSVDVVLLDVMMPGTSGIEGCRRFKAAAGDDYLPVILLTALAYQADRNVGLAAGADDFITKPFDGRELRLRVAAFHRLRQQELAMRAQLRTLQELTALKDDLVSLLVHDLRNPLATISVTAESLKGAAATEVDREDADGILRACRRMTRLVEELLTVRQLEEGALVLRRRRWNLEALSRAVLEAHAPVASSMGVALASRVPVGAEADFDGELVQRALENLVANAIRYAPRGTAVELGAAAGGTEVELTVTDAGPGVSPEMAGRLFEKYATVGSSPRGERRGFGLGLYLVRLVASAHGGGVSVSARPGGGTLFRLNLPAAA